MMPVLATLLILNFNYDITRQTKQNTWPCLISFLSLGKPQSVKKQQQQQNTTTRICLVPDHLPSLHPTFSPAQNTMSLCPNQKKDGMFSDGRVVENAFKIKHSLWPGWWIYIILCITLVIKKKSHKNHSISLPHVNPSNTLNISYPFSIPQSTLATCLSSIFIP